MISGGLQMVYLDTDFASFDCSKDHIRRHDMDYWSLILITGGGLDYMYGAEFHSSKGDLFVQSHLMPYSGIGHRREMIHLILNRDSFDDIADALNRHITRYLTGASGAILRDFVLSLQRNLLALTQAGCQP